MKIINISKNKNTIIGRKDINKFMKIADSLHTAISRLKSESIVLVVRLIQGRAP